MLVPATVPVDLQQYGRRKYHGTIENQHEHTTRHYVISWNLSRIMLTLWRTFVVTLTLLGVGGGNATGGVGLSKTSGSVSGSGSKCQEITIPMCKSTIGYNLTELPNQFNHDTQEEAGMEVHQYWPLVEIKCSTDLRFFICSLYVPLCMEDFTGTVPVCRSVCERARYGCEPVMIQYGFQWPDKMKCDRFPDYGTKKALCMDEKMGELPPKEPKIIPTVGVMPKGHSKSPIPKQLPPGQTFKTSTSHPNRNPGGPEKAKVGEPCSCKDCHFPLVRVTGKEAFNNSGILIEANGIPDCGIPCNLYKSPEEITFTTYWLLIWSSVCAFVTFLTLLTFIIDPIRFKYPERPIVYLSTCYLLVSVGYLIRLYKGHDEIACKGPMIRYNIEVGANSNPPGTSWGCTLVFLVIYYFGMASSIWWVILSLTWYLAAGCKWGSEAIASHAHLFHVVAWVLPALTTLIAILDGAVDGDPVAGICFIGNQDPVRLTLYIIVPLGILLILGTSFLLAGFIALVRIRRVLTKQVGRSKTEKLEKLMIRIGIFSILYTLPASAVIAAYLYEISAKKSWLEAITCNCGGNNGTIGEKPIYSILMLKYFMSLAVGITSGVWIWSGKTVDSWKMFLNKLCCRNGNGLKYTSAVYHQPTNPNNPAAKNLTHV